MYRSAWLRIAILISFAVLAAYSPGMGGHPFIVDAWLWRGVRSLVTTNVWLLPIGVFVAGAVADCLGSLCPPCRLPVRRSWLWALALGAVAAGVFWSLMVSTWLGDYAHVDRDPIPPLAIETAEPLGALFSTLVRMAGAAAGVASSTAVGLESVLCGAIAVSAIFLWARLLGAEWPLIFAMVVSGGYMVLFFGYPEKGTPKSVALVCWYIYFGTRALREGRLAPMLASSTVLSVASLMHGSALCWLPAHARYLWRRPGWRGPAFGIGCFLAPFILLGAYIYFGQPPVWSVLGNVAAPVQWIKSRCITNCGYDFWSAEHFLDVLNCLLVLSPMALLCLPEALWHGRKDGVGRWLVLGAAGWLFLSLTWFPVFGYFSDWDIFACTPLVLSYLAVYTAQQVMPPQGFRRLALAWITVSLLHTAAWLYQFHGPL